MITVEESLSQENKQCINNYSGIENADSRCVNASMNCGTEIKHGTKPHSNPHYSDIEQEAAMEMTRSENMDQSSQEASLLPGVGFHQGLIDPKGKRACNWYPRKIQT